MNSLCQFNIEMGTDERKKNNNNKPERTKIFVKKSDKATLPTRKIKAQRPTLSVVKCM